MVEILLGKWRGQGLVVDKAINYGQYLSIKHFATPKGQCYRWISRTWKQPGDLQSFPMHSEIGMFRAFAQENGVEIELMLTHPFGLSENESGLLTGNSLQLRSTALARTPKTQNPNVIGIRRVFDISPQELTYRTYLTLNEREEFLHLEASLIKENQTQSLQVGVKLSPIQSYLPSQYAILVIVQLPNTQNLNSD